MKLKILWNFQTEADDQILAKTSDLVLISKNEITCYLVDCSVSTDPKVKTQEKEKIEKYFDFSR